MILFALLAGLAIGSFLNVVIIRGAKGERLGGRSRCESCLKTLSFRELIPLVSFFLQKGRCLNCRAPLSWQYPAVEAGTAFLYGLSTWMFSRGFIGFLELIELIVGISAAIVIIVSDFRYQIIPSVPVIILSLLGLGIGFSRKTLLADFSFALGIAAFFTLLWLISRGRWIGLGDAELAFAVSLIVGYPLSLVALLFGSAEQSVLSLFYLGENSSQIKFLLGHLLF